VEVVSMEELLTRSDVISVHARLTAENGRMFAREEFGRMRAGAYFINTAREGLVDEDALGEALARGHLRGAALDVLERTPGRHPLLGRPNVFVTPHIGGATGQTLARGASRAVAAVTDLLAGRVPANVVNPQVLQGTR
jgi:D-3-phosphoglycerate dehydrogenase / 2-oxoglutarate reductase